MKPNKNTSYSATLNQAIMRSQPEFFSWSKKKQDTYRLNLPKRDREAIKKHLLMALFDIELAPSQDLESAFEAFTDKQYLIFNNAILPFTGIGENSFFLNEVFQDKTVLDFKTLYDYDFDDYQYQEAWRVKDFDGYVKQPYYGSLYFTWARLMHNGKFYYATLSCLTGYIVSQIEGHAHEVIQTLLPHNYKDGKTTAKPMSNMRT